MRDYFTEETVKIREMISRDPSYSELSDEQLKERAEKMMELRIRQAEESEPDVAAYYPARIRTAR